MTAPVKHFQFTMIEGLYTMDAILEHVDGNLENMTFVMVYSIIDSWVQEVYHGLGWNGVRSKVKDAFTASGGGPVDVVVVNGMLIDFRMEESSPFEEEDEEDGPGSL